MNRRDRAVSRRISADVSANASQVGERVATIKLGAVLSNVIQRKDAPSWGPNAQFRYPANGTGQVWLRLFDRLPEANKRLRARVTAVRTAPGKKSIELADGTSEPYDALLSTMPLPQLLRMMPDHPHLADLAEGENGAADHSRFKHQTVNLVGVGVWGTSVPDFLNGVHWVYFPEPEFIFYRVTCLSNFSPFMVREMRARSINAARHERGGLDGDVRRRWRSRTSNGPCWSRCRSPSTTRCRRTARS